MTLIDTTLYAKASKELEKIIQAELDRPDINVALATLLMPAVEGSGLTLVQ